MRLPPNHSHSTVSTLQTSYSDNYCTLTIMRWINCSSKETLLEFFIKMFQQVALSQTNCGWISSYRFWIGYNRKRLKPKLHNLEVIVRLYRSSSFSVGFTQQLHLTLESLCCGPGRAGGFVTQMEILCPSLTHIVHLLSVAVKLNLGLAFHLLPKQWLI